MTALLRRVCFVLPLCLCLAGPAPATVLTKPYQIRVVQRPEPPVPGRSGRLVLGVTATRDLTIDGIELSGPGWRVLPADAPFLDLAVGQEAMLAFDLTPDGTWNDLALTFVANDRPVTHALRLAPADVRARSHGGDMTFRDEIAYGDKAPPAPVIDAAGLMEPTAVDKLPAYRSQGEPDPRPGADKATHPVTLHGRIEFEYEEDFYPVYGATVVAEWRLPINYYPLGTTTADRDGNFSITFEATDGMPMDLGFSVYSSNSAFSVMEDELIDRDIYHWRSFTLSNFVGDGVSYGDVVLGGGYIGALNITSAMSRANSFLRQHTGLSSLPYLDVWWPTSDGASYYDEESTWNSTADIYIRNIRSWWNGTHIHEYGHHFIYSVYPEDRPVDPNYCNIGSFCDDPSWWGTECHHCGWCPENTNVAFSEGFPNWLADIVCTEWYYNEASNPIGSRHYNSIQECGESHAIEDPWRTEGAFAALLHDVTSNTYNNDPAYDQYADNMTASPDEVLDVVRTHYVVSPWEFIFDFKDSYPGYNEKFWQVCRNNGFAGIDTIPPAIGTLSSVSHPVGSTSPDNTIGVLVTGSTDNFSGVKGYCLTWQYDSAPEPGYVMNRAETGHFIQTDQLFPGTYYLALRAVDYADNWAADYRTYGPVTVRATQPSDLAPEPWTADWAYPLVPKDTQVASQQVIPADTDLLGDATYWNACVTNDGEETVTDHNTSIRLDGVEVASYAGQVLPWGDHAVAVNRGPLFITGGRHTFEMAADFGELVAEADETNNTWGKQWIWEPTDLGPDAVYGRMSPPARTGGWTSVADVTRWYNCNGYRIDTSMQTAPSTWVATWIRTDDAAGDLDVRLHDGNDSSTQGFAANQGASTRPAGCLDAVIVNAANRLASYYDVGVITSVDEEPEYFYIQAAYGEELTEGVMRVGHLEAGEGLNLYTFEGSPNANYTVYLKQTETGYLKGPLWLTWYDQYFATGSLLGYDGVAETDSTRGCELSFDSFLAVENVHAFAVWRDPSLNDFSIQDYTIVVRETPPDLAVNQPTGWAAPLVPRLSADATSTSAPEPTILLGDQASTYVNYSLSNDSPVPTELGFSVATLLDGAEIYTRLYMPFAGNAVSYYLPSTAQTVRGGRHTLGMDIDPSGGLVESRKDNNGYATQYVWRPSYLPWGALVARSEPPERTAGWDLLDSGELMWFNCDGMRTYGWKPSGVNNYWGAVAIMPAAAADLDLDLHFWTNNPRDSFDEPLVSSVWSQGQSDFVLMNFHNTGTKYYDVGILQAGTPTGEGYHVTTASSVGLTIDPDGVIGTFNLAATEILDLHEIDFTTAGRYRAQLAVSDPALDLGFSLYGPDLVQGGKSDVQSETAAAWLATGGDVDSFEFTVPPGGTGRHCLAVWKVGAADLPLASDYTLTITQEGVSGVRMPDSALATALHDAAPNPFNPRTRLSFDLAAAGPVTLRIYSLDGRLVTTLLDENLDAGSHEVAWNGRDAGGRATAAGIYLYQLRALGQVQTRRMTLLK